MEGMQGGGLGPFFLVRKREPKPLVIHSKILLQLSFLAPLFYRNKPMMNSNPLKQIGNVGIHNGPPGRPMHWKLIECPQQSHKTEINEGRGRGRGRCRKTQGTNQEKEKQKGKAGEAEKITKCDVDADASLKARKQQNKNSKHTRHCWFQCRDDSEECQRSHPRFHEETMKTNTRRKEQRQ